MKSSVCGVQLVLCMLNFCFIDGAPAGNEASSSRDLTADYKEKFHQLKELADDKLIRGELQKEFSSKGLELDDNQLDIAKCFIQKYKDNEWRLDEDNYVNMMTWADVFVRNDRDNDKFLTAEELKSAVTECGEEMTIEDAAQWIKDLNCYHCDRIHVINFASMLFRMKDDAINAALIAEAEAAESDDDDGPSLYLDSLSMKEYLELYPKIYPPLPRDYFK